MPDLEAIRWSGKELLPIETADLVADTLAMVTYLVHAADETVESVDYYAAIAEKLDDESKVQSAIALQAKAGPQLDRWQHEPADPWVVKLHIDEALFSLAGYSKAATIIRRTFIGMNPHSSEPFRIARSHELRRRSEHKFYKPKNPVESNLLKQYGNFNRTALVQGDRALLQAALEVLETTDEKAETVYGWKEIDADD